LTTEVNDTWKRHRLFFPKGWRRSPHKREDAFSFALESSQERAFVLDASAAVQRYSAEALTHPLRSTLSFHLPYHVRQLELGFDFPRGYEPERWTRGSGGGTRHSSP